MCTWCARGSDLTPSLRTRSVIAGVANPCADRLIQAGRVSTVAARQASIRDNALFAVEGVVRWARRWPGRGRGLPRMEVTMISGSKCSGSGWSPIGRFSGAGLSSPSDGVVAADARARPGTRWSGGWRTSRSGGGPRCWRSASADTGVTPPPTTGTRTDDAPRAVSRRRCRRSSRAGCPRGPRAGRSPGSRAGTPTATSAPCPAVRSRGCAGRRSRGSGRTPPGRRR
jgi:hypothetical protein